MRDTGVCEWAPRFHKGPCKWKTEREEREPEGWQCLRKTWINVAGFKDRRMGPRAK